MKALLALSTAAMLFSACANEPAPAPPNRPTGAELETALNDQLAQMVDLVQKQKKRLTGSTDVTEVVVVPMKRIENDTQGYLNDRYIRTLTDLFIDQMSTQEYNAKREELAVVPADSGSFYRVMQVVGIRQIEDCLIGDNMEKISAALNKEGVVAHGFARLKLQEGLDDRDYIVRIEIVPMDGGPPIRTRGRAVPRKM